MKKNVLAGALLGMALVSSSQAEDRALLIGVGEYANPRFNLPGIDLDIGMMQKTARLMGFDNVKTVLNDQATLNNVTRTMEDFLVKGVSAGDRVLIYYSGHGTRIPDTNGDETDDNADEVLTMHDLRRTTIDGKPSLEGILVDDKFNEILKKIPSRDVLVLVDACNSGSSTKSIVRGSVLGDDLETVSKFLEYPGMPLVSKGNFMAQQKQSDDNYVAISAAGDQEFAQATSKGSLFTLGVSRTLAQAARDKTPMTPDELMIKTTQFIQAENKKDPFTPRLSGSGMLAHKAIKLRENGKGHGDVWQRLAKMADQASPITISLNQKTYKDGDPLTITVNNTETGYLNVINVGPKDEPTVLFPNQHNPDSKVNASVTLPTPQMPFELAAQQPYGPSLIVAFFTTEPLNLYRNGDAARDQKGNLDNLFHSLSELGLKQLRGNFGVSGKGPKVRAGKVITEVCASACD